MCFNFWYTLDEPTLHNFVHPIYAFMCVHHIAFSCYQRFIMWKRVRLNNWKSLAVNVLRRHDHFHASPMIWLLRYNLHKEGLCADSTWFITWRYETDEQTTWLSNLWSWWDLRSWCWNATTAAIVSWSSTGKSLDTNWFSISNIFNMFTSCRRIPKMMIKFGMFSKRELRIRGIFHPSCTFCVRCTQRWVQHRVSRASGKMHANSFRMMSFVTWCDSIANNYCVQMVWSHRLRFHCQSLSCQQSWDAEHGLIHKLGKGEFTPYVSSRQWRCRWL